jgi:hypothetical protein
MDDTTKRLILISGAPPEKEAYAEWLKLADAVSFLKDNTEANEFVMYASLQSMFINALAVPSRLVTPPDVEDLMNSDCNAWSSWGLDFSFSDPNSARIVPPLDHVGSKTLSQGEQFVFGRRFEGRVGNEGYFEVLQKFTHVFDLHFLESRSAYCRLDKQGDIEDVIRIVRIPARGSQFGGHIVTFNRDVLDQYLTLTESTIVRTFDVTRFDSGFSGWSDRHDVQHTIEADIFYRSHIEPGHASYMRGCQIVRSLISKESIIKRHDFSNQEKQYASFIAYDWRHKVVKEISCAPGQTANYFIKSDLPYELSPAFFRPEVLSKYKADSDKYRLEERSISCRGTWHLQTYDINEAGQVHSYLVYLRNLPYEEQLYWKAYNENPKGSISKRAFETDFKGNWHTEYNPLNNLKALVHAWDHAQVPWWTLRSEKLPDQVHYPVTASPDEWANEILQLDQLVVEGFETKWLRTSAERLGRKPEANWASLRLIEECLNGLGFEEAEAKQIVAPLKTAHNLRTKFKGHASGDEGIEIKKQILAEHGSYKEHFYALSAECDQSLQTIAKAFEKMPSNSAYPASSVAVE